MVEPNEIFYRRTVTSFVHCRFVFTVIELNMERNVMSDDTIGEKQKYVSCASFASATVVLTDQTIRVSWLKQIKMLGKNLFFCTRI